MILHAHTQRRGREIERHGQGGEGDGRLVRGSRERRVAPALKVGAQRGFALGREGGVGGVQEGRGGQSSPATKMSENPSGPSGRGRMWVGGTE